MDVDMVDLNKEQFTVEEEVGIMDVDMVDLNKEQFTVEEADLDLEINESTLQLIKNFKYSKERYPDMTQSHIIEMLTYCGNYIESLNISQGIFDSSVMPYVGDYCKNLTILKFEYDVESETNNTENYIKAFKQLDKLRMIHITVLPNKCQENSSFPSEIINSLPEESLTHIYLLSKKSADTIEFLPMDIISINFSLKKFKNLKWLSLEHCSISDSMIEEISEKTLLIYLHIFSCIFEEKLLIFNELSSLKYINISCYYQKMNEKYTSSTINSIIKKSEKLVHLAIGSYNGTCNLREISFSDWKNLQFLKFLYIAVDSIDDLSIILVKYCKELIGLSVALKGEKTITKNALENLSKLKNLQDFKLHMMEISVESIIYISNNFKKLRSLLLPKLTEVQTDGSPHSSTSVLDELSNLKHLLYLCLLNGEQLQDSTIIAIANKCKKFQSIIVHNCPKITETSFDALANMKSLRNLCMTGNNNITDKSANKLRELRTFILEESPLNRINLDGAMQRCI